MKKFFIIVILIAVPIGLTSYISCLQQKKQEYIAHSRFSLDSWRFDGGAFFDYEKQVQTISNYLCESNSQVLAKLSSVDARDFFFN